MKKEQIIEFAEYRMPNGVAGLYQSWGALSLAKALCAQSPNIRPFDMLDDRKHNPKGRDLMPMEVLAEYMAGNIERMAQRGLHLNVPFTKEFYSEHAWTEIACAVFLEETGFQMSPCADVVADAYKNGECADRFATTLAFDTYLDEDL